MLFCDLFLSDLRRILANQKQNFLLNKQTYRKYLIILYIAQAILFHCCNSEKKILKKYIENKNSISLLILTPEQFYKTNKKTYYIPHFDSLDKHTRDSLLFSESKFIKHINDTEMLKLYSNSLIKEFPQYNVNVFVASNVDSFLMQKSPLYVFNLSQIELEEYEIPVDKFAVFDEKEYSQHFDLNAVKLNVWYEVTEVNVDSGIMTILYDGQILQDKIKAYFSNIFWNEVKCFYNKNDINISNIYTLFEKSGEQHASYIFDYIINKYLYKSLSKKPLYYYHYNKTRHKIKQAKEKRFIFM